MTSNLINTERMKSESGIYFISLKEKEKEKKKEREAKYTLIVSVV